MRTRRLVLLDTHAVFWLAQVPEELSRRAVETMERERSLDGLAISSQTLWELAWMITRGRVGVRTSVLDFLQTVEVYFTVLPVTSAVANRATRFSDQFPKDPTDRLIGATAIVHGMQLVTRDGPIRDSGEVACIW